MKYLKLIICSAGLLIGVQAKAQFVEIIPANPTENDSVRIAFNIVTGNISYFIENSLSLNNNVVDYDICLEMTAATSPSSHKDTFLLSKLSTGNYTVDITRYKSINSTSCIPVDSVKYTDSFYVASAVSLPEHQLLQRLKVYPNPAKDRLFVKSLDGLEINEIEIRDVQGKLIKTKILDPFSQGERNIDISKLPSGTYLLMFRTSEGTASRQFVKE